jgi:Short C-terminal domain
MVDTLRISYTGRLGLVHRLAAMLQEDRTTLVRYDPLAEASGADPDATETATLLVQVADLTESLTNLRAKAAEFMRRHQGVTVSIEEPDGAAPEPGEDFVQQLETLARLHQDGQLTDVEFERAKARLLGTG